MARDFPRLWLFDFDNTLVRLEPCVDWAASRRELEPMLREAGAPPELFERFPKRNLPLYEAYRAHLASGAMTQRARETLARASGIIERFELLGVDRAAPLEGAVELLGALRARGAKIGVVSSNSSPTIRRWFELRGHAQLVDVIAGRDLLLPLKPAPDSLTHALALTQVEPADGVYVGDVEGDFEAASAAGIKFYGIAATQDSARSFAGLGVGHVFASPAALLVYLNL